MLKVTRCAWVPEDNTLYAAYHDNEWGVPQFDDRKLFEHLLLETAQAGLSWLTILRKRDAYREAFAQFSPQAVAAFTENRVTRLLMNPGIIRNRAKIEATVSNAKAFLRIQDEFGSFASYQWHFVGERTRQNAWHSVSEVPAVTTESKRLSADLKARGFRFIGPTTIYAHMQATGMVNDHTVDCFRHDQIKKMCIDGSDKLL